jgi:hypothetical protein
MGMFMFNWETDEKTCFICGDPFDSPSSSRLGKHQMNLHYAGGNGKTRAHCYNCVVRAVQVFKAIEDTMKPYRENEKALRDQAYEHTEDCLRNRAHRGPGDFWGGTCSCSTKAK